jgi:YfiH family protein
MTATEVEHMNQVDQLERDSTMLERSEVVPDLESFGIRAFTTTRAVGSFGLKTDEPVADVMTRWNALQDELRDGHPSARFATASQVHGAHVLVHQPGWSGWLRAEAADGHASMERGTAIAVAVADCVPVFLAHPSGAIALLHSGWRGTAARIVERAIDIFRSANLPAADLYVHTGPSICGKCYEVSADVYAQLTGRNPGKPTPIDLRTLIADHARSQGVRRITSSTSCTRCNNDQFYSYRAGDTGRQLGVMIADQQ